MPEEAPPISFVLDDGGVGVTLGQHDLPEPPIQWGGKLDETVTRYSQGEASVQVHGVEYEPVHLEGTLSDAWWGQDGIALSMRNQMLDLMHAGGVVRMEYGPEQLWGTFDCTFEEIRRDRIDYKIEFRPYWTEPPEYQNVATFAPAAVDDGVEVERAIQAFIDATTPEETPDEVDPGLATQTRTAVLSALNKHAAVMSNIGGVRAYADFNEQTVALVLRGLHGTHSALKSVGRRLDSLAPDAVSEDGAARMRAQSWTMDVEKRIRVLSAEVLAFIRKFVEAARPASTRTYVVAAGDTLQSIARELLGDFSRWTELANYNDMETTDLAVGQTLEVPPR